jgi:hypothetical protein
MPDEIRVNRPQAQFQHPQSMPRQDMSAMPEMMEPQKSSKAPWIILAVVVVVLAVLAILFRGQLFKGSGAATTTADQQSSGYQAVFLTNGQVYFGKLANPNSDYPVLTDIYYLQVVQPPLQGQQNGQAAAATPQQQISLVKLGNELHGPVDEMHIAKAQILFYEDMKTDSQVVKAIQAYKANPSGTPAVTPTPAQ